MDYSRLNILTIVLEKQILEEDMEKIQVLLNKDLIKQRDVNICQMTINEYERLCQIIVNDLNKFSYKSMPQEIKKYYDMFYRYKAHISELYENINHINFSPEECNKNLNLVKKCKFKIDEINRYII